MAGKQPVILVVHENRGLNPHIEDIARSLALADFVAAATLARPRTVHFFNKPVRS